MLIDPKNNESQAGFNPNVTNKEIYPKATGLMKLIWYIGLFSIVFTIFLLIWWYKKRNWFNQKQIAINEAASLIDINQKKRSDLLIKLLEQTKGYLKHEKSLLSDIARLRTIGTRGPSSEIANQIVEQQKVLDNVQTKFQINVEAYPDLKANQMIANLMSSSELVELEIAASRRLYNRNVTEFNQVLFTFPSIIVAEKIKLYSLPMFAASEQEKQDIDMSSLSA